MMAGSNIVKVYADLVRKGKKKISEVPAAIRKEVKALLAGDEK